MPHDLYPNASAATASRRRQLAPDAFAHSAIALDEIEEPLAEDDR